MKKGLKRLITWGFILVLLALISYGGYRLYNYAIDVAIERIQKGVAKGVSKGVGDVINPFKWFGKKRKKDAGED